MLRRRPRVDDRRRDIGFICDFHSPNLKFICRTGFTGRAPEADYPLANRFDEVDTLVIFDNVPIPWENGLCGAVQGAARTSNDQNRWRKGVGSIMV